MGTSIVVALASLALVVAMQRLALRSRARTLKLREQAFRFHAIRDQLQDLAIEGVIKQGAPTYEFLMFAANVAIKNAGILRLRDVLRVARTVDERVQQKRVAIWRDMKRHPEPVQRLFADTFGSMAAMLIANDWIVRAGVWAAFCAAQAWDMVRPVVQALIRAADTVAGYLSPTHAEAVEKARRFQGIRTRLPA